MINVIGIGLDGAEGLTEKVKQIIDRASLLIGSDRHLQYFPDCPAERFVLGNFLAAIARIEQHLTSDLTIVVLVSGDPLFFGLGRLLVEKLPPQQLRFHPHLSSIQLAFNRLKVPWQDAKIISVHGRSLDELFPCLQGGIEKIAILTDRQNHPGAIANFYLELDLPVRYDLYICENLGGESEEIHHFSGREIPALATRSSDSFAPLNIVVLLRQKDADEKALDLKNLPLFGLNDSVFLTFPDRPTLMTKREIRMTILGELALQPQQIIWDIGAGTGSVSIEIARLCPTSRIYAIEKTAIGVTLIEKNCQRLQVSNVIPLHGSAPDVLDNLPSPHRIFIGGSSGKLEEILAVCRAKLQPDGIVVLALATLEHINQCMARSRNSHWDYHLLQVQISRSVPIGKLTRFSPLNPVTIIKLVNLSQTPNSV